MKYRIFKREWPMKKTRWTWLMYLTELIVLIPILVIFGIAQPDSWRTEMWAIGYENGWASDYRMELYAAANYRPPPDVPFVWSQTLTDFNVVITIVTLFALIIKMILFIMKVLYPLLSLLLHASLVALWVTSVYGLAGPDTAHPDSAHHSRVAWYISRSCDAAGRGRFDAVKECKLSKASFAVAIVMLAVMLMHFGVAVWAMWPTEADRKGAGAGREKGGAEDEDDEYDVDSDPEAAATPATATIPMKSGRFATETTVSMMGAQQGPMSPGRTVPYTPRTMAFKQLDRKLPLRQQYG